MEQCVSRCILDELLSDEDRTIKLMVGVTLTLPSHSCPLFPFSLFSRFPSARGRFERDVMGGGVRMVHV